MQMNFSIPVIALIAGTAIGYCVAPGGAPAGDEAGGDDPVARKSITSVDPASSGLIAELRAKIKELQAELEEKNSIADAFAASEKIDEKGGEERGRREFRSPREFIEEMKKNDPERYAQMTNHMAQFRQRRLERAQSRLDFLASIDMSQLGDEAQATHLRLQELIAKREDVEANLHSEDISDEDREAAFREMVEMEREMRELNRQERDNLIAETVRELGYNGEDATAVVDTLKEIISATGNGGWMGPGPGGPGGPGARGFGGGRRGRR